MRPSFPTLVRVSLLLALAGAPACTPARLTAGTYVETSPPGSVLWVGQSVRLAGNHAFTYRQWSDDLSGSRYGAGTYQLTRRQLRLVFAAQTPLTAQAQLQPLAFQPDSLHLTFLVERADTAQAPQAIPFATIIAYNGAGRPLATTLSDTAGRATLHLARTEALAFLKVASLGFLSWQQPGPPASTAYRVRLPGNQGTPYAAGTVKVFQLRRLPDGQSALRAGRHQLPLLLQPAK